MQHIHIPRVSTTPMRRGVGKTRTSAVLFVACFVEKTTTCWRRCGVVCCVAVCAWEVEVGVVSSVRNNRDVGKK